MTKGLNGYYVKKIMPTMLIFQAETSNNYTKLYILRALLTIDQALGHRFFSHQFAPFQMDNPLGKVF